MTKLLTEKQYNLILRLLRSKYLNIDKALNTTKLQGINRIEAHHLIDGLIRKIRDEKQIERDFENLLSNPSEIIDEVLINAN